MKKISIIDSDGYLSLTVKLPVVDTIKKAVAKIPGQFMPFYIKKLFAVCVDKFIKESV